MSLEKPTYRQRFMTVKSRLDHVMMLAVDLKEVLEYEVDKMDENRVSKKVKSQKWHDRYLKYVQAVDDLDKIVGHLAEADGVRVEC